MSQAGQLGVVSGTGLAVVIACRLQVGDAGGHVRRAAAAFPIPQIAQRIIDRYFVPSGKNPAAPFRSTRIPQIELGQPLTELTVVANFVEVYLAKEGHSGVVGINYLEKIQTPRLASLYGAMLAGVDYVLMGAGIPRLIPGMLDGLAARRAVSLRVDVEGTASGGHNAPPRGPMQLTSKGEPIYGPRNDPDLAKIAEIGLPFYLATLHHRRHTTAAAPPVPAGSPAGATT